MTENDAIDNSCPFQDGLCYYCKATIKPFFIDSVSAQMKRILGGLSALTLGGKWMMPSICDKCSAEKEYQSSQDYVSQHKWQCSSGGVRDYSYRLMLSGFQASQLIYTFENFKVTPQNKEQHQEGLNYILNPNNGLYINGDVGTGKTYLMICIARSLIMQAKSCEVTSVSDILLNFRKTINNEIAETEQDLLNKYIKCDYLFIDDLGSEKLTEYNLDILYQIIDKRMNSIGKYLIVTSNIALPLLGENTSARIASRISGHCKNIRMSGHDWRLK